MQHNYEPLKLNPVVKHRDKALGCLHVMCTCRSRSLKLYIQEPRGSYVLRSTYVAANGELRTLRD